jgi:hypothetical protein
MGKGAFDDNVGFYFTNRKEELAFGKSGLYLEASILGLAITEIICQRVWTMLRI